MKDNLSSSQMTQVISTWFVHHIPPIKTSMEDQSLKDYIYVCTYMYLPTKLMYMYVEVFCTAIYDILLSQFYCELHTILASSIVNCTLYWDQVYTP